ncbi:MAG: hypothetical protein ACQEP3_02795 [Patescibacteria group bacterium]
MEDFLQYLIDPHRFDPNIVRIIDYTRYLFTGLGGGMFVAIIYFIVRTNLLEEKYLKDIAEFTQKSPYQNVRIPKNWKKIRKQSEDEDESTRKLAIMEADDMVAGILNGMGYKGEDLEESLEEVSKEIIPNKQDLLQAHKTRRDLIYDPNYDLSIEDAREIINIYEETLEDLQLL